jgi:hypothetical protein
LISLFPLFAQYEACLGLTAGSRGSPSSFVVLVWFYGFHMHPRVSSESLRLSPYYKKKILQFSIASWWLV